MSLHRNGKRSWRSVAVAGAVLTAALAVAGCGDEGSEEAGQPEVAAAAEPARVFTQRMAKLIQTARKPADCAELSTIDGRSLAGLPCPPDKALAKSMASFEFVGAEEYGTGAVVDYRSGQAKDGAAILLFVAPDRQWGVSRFGVVTKPSVETSDERSRAGFRKAAEDYVEAIRERDCAAFDQAAFTDGVTGGELCRTRFASTKGLAKRLKANPDATPVYEGGNSSYGFFSLETAKPEPASLTISVVGSGVGAKPSYYVLDAAPGPTAADRRKAVRQAQRKGRQSQGVETEPSSEPLP